jgi:hypothetical protein
VLTRVARWRVIAAADVTAGQTDAQVQPHAAVAQAVLTAIDGLGELGDFDLVEVRAGSSHSFKHA